MSGHTPGPWMVGETLRADALAVIGDGDSVVCEFPDRLGASVDADARLIAAAPELLVALDHLLLFAVHADSCGDQDAYNNAETPSCGCGLEAIAGAARAAIAKATGGAA